MAARQIQVRVNLIFDKAAVLSHLKRLASWQAYRDRNREKLREANRARYWRDVEASRGKHRQWYEENKPAMQAKALTYYAEHTETRRIAHRGWLAANAEKVRGYKREYNKKNWERVSAASKRYYAKHADEFRAYTRAWVTANPARARAAKKAWAAANRDRVHAAKRRRYAREAGAVGNAPPAQIAARVAYFGNRCAYCGGAYETLDHVIPLSKGGTHWPANLRPACFACNSSKKDRRLAEWRRRGAHDGAA